MAFESCVAGVLASLLRFEGSRGQAEAAVAGGRRTGGGGSGANA